MIANIEVINQYTNIFGNFLYKDMEINYKILRRKQIINA